MPRHTKNISLVLLTCIISVCGSKSTHAVPPPEVFAAFAGGWLDYQDGHYAESMRSFHAAALMDSRFTPAYVGLESCSMQMGFPQIAQTIHAYRRQLNGEEARASNLKRVAFWGLHIDGDQTDIVDTASSEKSLLNQLRSLVAIPVDVIRPLAGKNQGQGNPVPYAYNMIALVGVDEAGLYLDLVVIQQLDVSTTYAVTALDPGVQKSPLSMRKQRISLADTEMAAFLKSSEFTDLLGSFMDGEEAWPTPGFIPKYSPLPIKAHNPREDLDWFQFLATQASMERTNLEMAAIALRGKPDIINNPQHLSYVIFWGYMKWLAKNLESPEARSVVALWIHDFANGRSPFTDEDFAQDRIKRLEKVAEAYPEQLGGKIARLNFLIRELSPENIDSGIGDGMQQLLRDIENNPLVQNTRSICFVSNRYHPSGSGSNSSYSKNFSVFRKLLGGDSDYDLTDLKRQLLPLFHRASAYLTTEGGVTLIFYCQAPEASFPVALAGQLPDEAKAMLTFHADFLSRSIEATELLDALERDSSKSIYLTWLATRTAKQLANKDLAEAAARRILGEIEHPEYERVAFQALVAWCYRFVDLLEPSSHQQLSRGIIEELERNRWDDRRTKNQGGRLLRSIYEVVHESNAEQVDAIFESVIANRDRTKLGWLFDSYWYFEWRSQGDATRAAQFLQRFEEDIQQVLSIDDPNAIGKYVPFFHVKIAQQYLAAGLKKEALQWLAPFETMQAVEQPDTRDEHMMIAGRVYLAAYLLSEGHTQKAVAIASDAIQRADGKQIKLDNRTLEFISPRWKEHDPRHATEAALLVRQMAREVR